jgi:hypothetical protein
MAESLTGASAAKEAPSSEAVRPKETGGSSRWRLRLPASVVVTLLVAALSTWIAPAIARQWDDRQKAQELKAAVVGDMATATSSALVGGEAIWADPPRQVNRAAIADDWACSSLAIEARLRAYFSQQIVTYWQIYTWLVDEYVSGDRAQATAALNSAAKSLATRRTTLDPPMQKAIADVLFVGRHHAPSARAPDFEGNGRLEQIAVLDLEQHLGRFLRPQQEDELEPASLDEVHSALVAYQEELTRRVLAAHTTSFSTNVQDLLDDLLPG